MIAGGELMVTDNGRDAVRRHALGVALLVWRTHKGLSKEHAADEASLAFATWNRIESGQPVRNASYAAVEHLIHLHPGTIAQALADDGRMVELARRLGVDVVDVDEGQPADAFVERLAMATPRRPGGDVVLPTVHVKSGGAVGRPTVLLVAEVVQRLGEDRDATPAKASAVEALLKVMPELAGCLR